MLTIPLKKAACFNIVIGCRRRTRRQRLPDYVAADKYSSDGLSLSALLVGDHGNASMSSFVIIGTALGDEQMSRGREGDPDHMACLPHRIVGEMTLPGTFARGPAKTPALQLSPHGVIRLAGGDDLDSVRLDIPHEARAVLEHVGPRLLSLPPLELLDPGPDAADLGPGVREGIGREANPPREIRLPKLDDLGFGEPQFHQSIVILAPEGGIGALHSRHHLLQFP